MTRRGFFGLAAGMVLDPERLLWVPGAKTISIPAPSKVTEWVRTEWVRSVQYHDWAFTFTEQAHFSWPPPGLGWKRLK